MSEDDYWYYMERLSVFDSGFLDKGDVKVTELYDQHCKRNYLIVRWWNTIKTNFKLLFGLGVCGCSNSVLVQSVSFFKQPGIKLLLVEGAPPQSPLKRSTVYSP